MKHENLISKTVPLPSLCRLPIPVKALMTAVILVMGIALLGALGQIIVHDIIPTFFIAGDEGFSDTHGTEIRKEEIRQGGKGRGDLLADLPVPSQKSGPRSIPGDEQFVWLLKWTHIHLFGMNMIFIFMGSITIFLDVGSRLKFWLVVLPFIGVLIDIAAMWLRAYLSPVFFWLHIPGGGLFVTVYGFVSIKAMAEMWLLPLGAEEGTHDKV